MRGVNVFVCRTQMGAAGILALAGGCPLPSPPPPDVQPDMKAIATVVTYAYGHEGDDRPVVFPDTSDVCGAISPDCEPSEPDGLDPELKERIEAGILLETGKVRKVRAPSEACYDDLSLPGLTPVLCDTGEIGVSISLGRFREGTEHRWHVPVTIARSGLDSTVVEYTIERNENAWVIVDPAPDADTLDARILAADRAEVVEGHPDLGPTISLLEEYAGDLETTFYILDNMQTWRACRWRLAAAHNPEHLDEICDRMAETLQDEVLPHEVDACHSGEGCLIY